MNSSDDGQLLLWMLQMMTRHMAPPLSGKRYMPLQLFRPPMSDYSDSEQHTHRTTVVAGRSHKPLQK